MKKVLVSSLKYAGCMMMVAVLVVVAMRISATPVVYVSNATESGSETVRITEWNGTKVPLGSKRAKEIVDGLYEQLPSELYPE